MGDIETVYCVKYALSTGVYKVSGREDGKYFEQREADGKFVSCLWPNQWARTELEAIRAVKIMVARRQRAILAEKAKLESMAMALGAGVLPLAKEGK